MRYGIIGALDEEIALVKEQMTEVKEHKLYGRSFYTGRIGKKEIVLVCCGVGKVNAALFANAVIREFHADNGKRIHQYRYCRGYWRGHWSNGCGAEHGGSVP